MKEPTDPSQTLDSIETAPDDETRIAVNNTLVNLLGYPTEKMPNVQTWSACLAPGAR